MAERKNGTLYLLAAAVVLEAVALVALAIGQCGTCADPGKTPEVAAPVAPAPATTVQREVVVPVVQFDTDALAGAVAAKVEAKAAQALEEKVRALIAATPSPVGGPLGPKPIGAEAPPTGSKAPAAVKAPVAEKPTVVPEAPKMPPPPEGSYVTKFGAQPATGPEDAPVLIFVMSDFQCPVCKRAADGLKPLLTEFEDVRWVFWNNPLDMHRRARAAAAASMAAFRQGKFWEYHDALFENSRALQDADLAQYAKDLGLDMDKFAKDLADETLDFQFDANMRVASLLEARGTPSFVINGRKQVGWGSAGGVRSMVQREVDAAKALVAEGKTPAEAREARARENAKTPEDLEAYLAHMLKGEIPAAAAE
jgi:protein-disulfide isomerase